MKRRFANLISETKGRGTDIELILPEPAAVSQVVIMEDISQGERIRKYTISGLTEAGWKQLAAGESVGHKRIEKLDVPVSVSRMRPQIAAAKAEPIIGQFGAYGIAADS